MIKIFDGKMHFTRNNMFVYQNHYSIIKISTSGHTTDLFTLLESQYENSIIGNRNVFEVLLNKIKDFRRVIIGEINDNDFSVKLESYRYGDYFVNIFLSLSPKILDKSLFSHTRRNELDIELDIHSAIRETQEELLSKWEPIREKIYSKEYIEDIDELIEVLEYAVLNRGFEKDDT